MFIKFHALAIAGLAAISIAKGDVVFSNITGADPGGIVICGTTSCGGFGTSPNTLAEEFTPSQNYVFNDAIVEIGDSFGDGNVNVFLATDSAGLPGAFIEQIGFALTANAQNQITANSIATPIQFVGGTAYWLVLTPADSDSAFTWDEEGSSYLNTADSHTENGVGSWTLDGPYNGQMEIDGTPGLVGSVPEPRSFLLLGCGLMLVGAGMARKGGAVPK